MTTPKKRSPTRGGREKESTISLLTTLCLLITIICLASPLILSCLLARPLVLMRQIITNENIA
jgi:hypothetical protein